MAEAKHIYKEVKPFNVKLSDGIHITTLLGSYKDRYFYQTRCGISFCCASTTKKKSGCPACMSK